MKKVSLGIFVKPLLQLFILVGILDCTFPRFANAQSQNLRFKHLTTNDGLSHSWVHSIIQDKYGFIWIGTDDGLNRYDGTNFRVYKNSLRDKHSLSSSSIMSVFEDSKGDLWIGTRDGLNLYDRQNDRFVKNPKWPQNQILAIAEDKNKTLWIGTTLNVLHLNVEHDSITIYNANDILQNKNNLLSSGSCGAIFVDSRNNLWIGTNKGLNLYDKEKNLFIYYYHEDHDPNSISNNDIRSIVEDNAGRLWIGTPAGLDLFTNAQDRSRNGIFVHYQNNRKDQNSISQGTVISLLEDDKHNLWIGTENGGLDLLNLNTYKKGVNSFVHFKNDPNRGNSLSNNSIYSLFQDKQGNIWIGTFGNGLNVMNPITEKFIHIMNEPGINNSLNNNLVNTFLEEKNFLWIGTEGGLNRYNKKNDTFKHYINDPLNKKSIGSNAVWALCKDKSGNLWVGTWGGGLNRFDYQTETFEHYYHDPKDTTSIGSNNMFSIFEDSRGSLWIGTMGGGLNKFDRKKKKFTRYNISNSGILTDYVQAIVEANNGDLWLANGNGFSCFNRTTNKFENYTHSANDNTSVSSNKVVSIFEDSKGNLWMGTDAGINLFNKSTGRFTCYQIENGLPDNFINSILEDGRGNLWIGTNKGLSKFINAINLPTKPEFKNYTYGDGLQGNGFGKRSCLRGADGMMYFGGTNGFNIFVPDKIKENTYIPPVVITDFKIFNKPVVIGDQGLKNDINVTENLVLSYTQTVFSFDFAALNYISSSKNQYAYKMEGFDKDWNYSGTKHSATYTNLDPGNYIFRVKGSNNDGVWNEKGVALSIMITPPFWKTWLFYTFCAIIVASSVTGAYRYKIYRVRENERNLKRKVEERTGELALEIAEHQKTEVILKHERNLFRLLIDHLPDAIFAKDTNYNKIFANIVDVRNMGLHSEAEVLGKGDFEFFPKELAEGFRIDDQSVIQTGTPILNREEFVFDEKGRKRFLQTSKLPLRDNQGQIIGLIGIGHDVTEQRQAQEALQQERKLLRTLIDNLPDLIYVKDTHCRKTISNRTDIQNLGRSSEADVLGKTDFDFYSKKVAETFYADDISVIQTGQPVLNREEYSIDENGNKRWLLTSKLPLRDEAGRIIGLVGIGHDITSRKEFEEALHESEERFRIIAEQTGQLVYDVQMETDSIHWAGAVKEVTGYTREDLQHLTLIDWRKNIHPDDYNSVMSVLDEARKTSTQYLIEYRFRCKNGNYIHVEDHGIFLRNELRTSQRMLGAIANITERKTASMERERLITELQNAIADIKVLSGLVPICSNCKKIRDDKGYWTQLEGYIQEHSQAKFSHGVCPDCMKTLYPNFIPKKKSDPGVSAPS